MDGVLESNGDRLRQGRSIAGGGFLYIGQNLGKDNTCSKYGPNKAFRGLVSGVYMWKSALERKDIYSLYRFCDLPRGNDIVSDWKKERITKTTAVKLGDFCQ